MTTGSVNLGIPGEIDPGPESMDLGETTPNNPPASTVVMGGI